VIKWSYCYAQHARIAKKKDSVFIMRKLQHGSMAQLKYFNFFMYGSWSLLDPFLPLYFYHVGFNSLQIGLLMSVGPLISLAANPFWGYWSDRLQNTRFIIILMLIGNIATSQIYFQTKEFLAVFLFMLLFYFFQTALNPLCNSLTLQAIENTDCNFGTFRLWGSLGFAIMVLAASPFIEMLGIHNLGYMYGFFAMITLCISFCLPKPKKQESKRQQTAKEVSRLMRSGLFVSFLLLSIICSIPNRMNAIFISVYISGLGGSEVHVGWSWFLAAILEVPLFLLLDRYLKTTERVMFGLMTIVSALFMLRWLLMSVAVTPFQVVLIQLIHAFTFGIMYYTGTQICNFLVPKSVRSSGQAIYGLCWMGVAGLFSGLLGGWLLDHFSAVRMYQFSAVLSGVGIIGYMAIWHSFRAKGQKLTVSS
jgi:PPP family 3-phenylpropionic acid transporter